jgi:hypothetical protein
LFVHGCASNCLATTTSLASSRCHAWRAPLGQRPQDNRVQMGVSDSPRGGNRLPAFQAGARTLAPAHPLAAKASPTDAMSDRNHGTIGTFGREVNGCLSGFGVGRRVTPHKRCAGSDFHATPTRHPTDRVCDRNASRVGSLEPAVTTPPCTSSLPRVDGSVQLVARDCWSLETRPAAKFFWATQAAPDPRLTSATLLGAAIRCRPSTLWEGPCSARQIHRGASAGTNTRGGSASHARTHSAPDPVH